MSNPFLNKIIEELNLFLLPLKEAKTNARVRYMLLNKIGIDTYFIDKLPIDDLVKTVDDIDAAIDKLLELKDSNTNFLLLILEIDKRVFAVMQAIKKLKTFLDTSSVTVPTLLKEEFKKIQDDAVPLELLNLLILEYLENNQLFIYKFLVIIGAIKPIYDSTFTLEKVFIDSANSSNNYIYRTPYISRRIDWTAIEKVLTQSNYFENLFGLKLKNTPYTELDLQNIADKVFPVLTYLFELSGLYAYHGLGEDAEQAINADTILDSGQKEELIKRLKKTFTYNPVSINPDTMIPVLEEKGVSISVVANNTNTEFLFFLSLFGNNLLNNTLYFNEHYLKYSLSANAKFYLGPKTFKFENTNLQSKINANIEFGRIHSDTIFLTIGDINGSYFQLGDYVVNGFLEADDKKNDLGIVANLKDVKLVIKPFGDGFLKKVIPAKGINIDLDFSVGYSKSKGLHFSESGTLTTQIAVYKAAFGVTLETVDLAITSNNGDMEVYVATTFKIEFSSFKVRIKKSGLRLKRNKAKPTTPSNNWDFGSLDFGFKLPTGLDFGFLNKYLKGGGGVDFEVSFGRYTGFIDLTIFDKIAVKALLVLDTKLPNGKEGYSLILVIQSVGFTPIQLGLGFSLTGIGGLIGYNRTMDVDALRDGIRNNAIESIFLPGDLVDTAPKIIKDLSAFFPIKEDQFLIGPLGQITWGAKSLLTIDFGLIIEFSKPFRIAIPGVLKTILPSPKEPLITLQVNFIGIIDFDKKYLSFDASLYNSFIKTFPVNGDMALRLTWGDNPFFLLTVGGFHPAYTPPPLNLPALRRLQIQIANKPDLKLSFKTYFALTSNSVQFGAAVYGFARAAGFEAEGYFNFDVLFLFSPFKFTAALAIGVSVKYDGREFMSAYLTLKLSGPAPWRAEGVAAVAIELLLFTLKARIAFDFESGSAALATKERIDVVLLLSDALKTKTNWTAYANNDGMVNILNWEDNSDTLFVAPNGSLGYIQNVMPANLTLEKFGNDLPNILDLNFKNIRVKDHTPGIFGLNTSAAKSNFPLGQFINLSDQDKLNASRSFQLLNSGFNLLEPAKLNVPYVNSKLIEYEQTIIDNANSGVKTSVGIAVGDFNRNLKNSAIAQSPLSNNYKNVQSAFSKKMVSNTIRYYAAQNSNGANIGGSGLVFDSPIEAEVYMKSAIKNNPNLMGNVSILNTTGV